MHRAVPLQGPGRCIVENKANGNWVLVLAYVGSSLHLFGEGFLLIDRGFPPILILKSPRLQLFGNGWFLKIQKVTPYFWAIQ
jgi:hypothetical protein